MDNLLSAAKRGSKNPMWKGGRYIGKHGYAMRLAWNHPHHNARGYIFEHRLVMEAHLGRFLLPTEVIHHINGVRSDNRLENLEVFVTKAAHTSFHAKQKQVELICGVCKKTFVVKQSLVAKRKHCSKQCCDKYFKGKTLNSGRTHFKKNMIPWNKGISA